MTMDHFIIQAFSLITIASLSIFNITGGQTVPSTKNSTKSPHLESALFSDLFDEYDKRIRPAANSSHPVDVEIGLYLRRIEYLDEKRQTLTFHATTLLRWVDKRLSWDPDQYQGTKDIAYASYALWIPDVFLSNDVDPFGTQNFEHRLASIFYDGQVNLATPSNYKVLCGMDFGNWPDDEQACTIEFESLTHDGNRINLRLMSDNESIAANSNPFASTNEWTLTDLKAKRNIKLYECCPGDYHSVYFTLYLRRKEHFYTPLIWTPLFAILISSWVLFLLDFGSTIKFVLGGVQVIAAGFFAMYLKHTIPPTVDKTPSIVRTNVEIIILILLANFVQLLTHSIWRRRSRMPNFIRTTFLSSLSRFCCNRDEASIAKASMPVPTSEGDLTQLQMEDPNEELSVERNSQEWKRVARYLNRICFIVYVIVSLIVLI